MDRGDDVWFKYSWCPYILDGRKVSKYVGRQDVPAGTERYESN